MDEQNGGNVLAFTSRVSPPKAPVTANPVTEIEMLLSPRDLAIVNNIRNICNRHDNSFVISDALALTAQLLTETQAHAKTKITLILPKGKTVDVPREAILSGTVSGILAEAHRKELETQGENIVALSFRHKPEPVESPRLSSLPTAQTLFKLMAKDLDNLKRIKAYAGVNQDAAISIALSFVNAMAQQAQKTPGFRLTYRTEGEEPHGVEIPGLRKILESRDPATHQR